MYRKKEYLLIICLILGSILYFLFSKKDEEENIITLKDPIQINIGGEIIRETLLIYYEPTTYGVVLNKIKFLKNEYSDFSSFNYKESINESLDILIPTIDVNNKYSSNKKNKICINTATKEELMTLYQIGEKRAEKILLYIKEQKRISSFEILKDIISVSDESIRKIKEQAYL